MLKAIVTVGALAGAMMLTPVVRNPAQAVPNLAGANAGVENGNLVEVRKRGGGGRHFGRGGGHRHIGRHFGGRHHFRGRKVFRYYGHRRHYRGPRVYIGHSCQWLRYRALATGSSYWWRRYYLCRRAW